LKAKLVVADESRTEKTICLAVTPALKAYGIPGRARLFEVNQKVREVERRTGEKVEFLIAKPQMAKYVEYSTKVYNVYLKYVSAEDIHAYSIDECFLDLTRYLKLYKKSARELVKTIIQDVFTTTGITATGGIGTNLYLCKIAMDVMAKHVDADSDGVRIAELDEMKYREMLWCHRPITDFWRVGRGLAARLEKLGCFTMGDVAQLSIRNEDLLYDAMGINAQLLIDHAWGWEPTEIAMIKSYRPETKSISSGQVLSEPYNATDGKLIVREMTELMALDLVRKKLVTKQVTLTINYDRESLIVLQDGRTMKDTVYGVAKTGKPYAGEVGQDYYGRIAPKHAHGTGNLDRYTSSARAIVRTMMALYDCITDPDLLIRRITIAACNLIPEDEIPAERPQQLDLFTDYTRLEQDKAEEKAAEAREKKLQEATLLMQEKFGKNAILKGMNLQKKATTRARNAQIGGHRAGDEEAEREKVE
jgi:DNA polymerase V